MTVTVIVAQDSAFYDQLPFLFPQADARSWYVGNEALIERTAFQNGSSAMCGRWVSVTRSR